MDVIYYQLLLLITQVHTTVVSIITITNINKLNNCKFKLTLQH